jgi:hypothetical protein
MARVPVRHHSRQFDNAANLEKFGRRGLIRVLRDGFSGCVAELLQDLKPARGIPLSFQEIT